MNEKLQTGVRSAKHSNSFNPFTIDGNAYCFQRTSVTGNITEATAAADVIFSLRYLVCYDFSSGWLSNRSTRIVRTVYANILAILWKCGNTALAALIFRETPGSGKLNYSFHINSLAFYNQYFFVFGSYHADYKINKAKNILEFDPLFNCL